jgi:dipeptidyl aminopeptidase/acylaminoacyl peptidase
VRLAPGGRHAYLAGNGASPKGDYPFLDRIDLATGRTERLWRAADPFYELVVDVLDDQAQRFVTRRESPSDPPNYMLRSRGSERVRALTAFPDPAPQLAGIKPEIVTYRREDGVELSAKLYVPPGWERSQGALPTLFWCYPQEFKAKAAAGRVVGSNNRFVRPNGSSHLLLLTQGIAIVDDPALPIIGEGEAEPNDTYVPQLVMGAKAAVDAFVARGVADPSRLAIGGHSYGAFTTANLLAHSDLFRAGIGRSGAYNRTLTPFGFQGEQRNFWEATSAYVEMSPFTHAAKIDEPLLLVHGGDDSNTGTFPIQSERLAAAIRGLGGTVRWVVLPREDHGYRARESCGHALWEMARWIDLHVKGAPAEPPRVEGAAAQ